VQFATTAAGTHSSAAEQAATPTYSSCFSSSVLHMTADGCTCKTYAGPLLVHTEAGQDRGTACNCIQSGLSGCKKQDIMCITPITGPPRTTQLREAVISTAFIGHRSVVQSPAKLNAEPAEIDSCLLGTTGASLRAHSRYRRSCTYCWRAFEPWVACGSAGTARRRAHQRSCCTARWPGMLGGGPKEA